MDDFARIGLSEGQEFLESQRGSGTVGGYVIAVAHSDGDVETVPLSRGWGGSGGRITTEALQYFENRLRRDLGGAGAIDGLAMHLHGACAAEAVDDVEGQLLAISRELLGPDVPIVLTLDHHANITQRMIDNCDAVVGFRTQPHDPLETGILSTSLLIRVVAGDVVPTMAWRKLRLISHQEQFRTSDGPMKVWFDRARELERDPRVLTISNFPMQPWLDVEEGGWATVVVTDDDQALAEHLADRMAELAWSLRAEFQEMDSVPPDDAVRAAEAEAAGVVLLSDQGDSVFGGAAGDSTVLIDTMLRLGIKGRALVPLVDAAAVAVLREAGPGSTVTVSLGGGISGLFRPIEVSGIVRWVGSEHVVVEDMFGTAFDMGTAAVLEVGAVTIVVSEHAGIAGNHPAAYRACGIEPADAKMIVVKTASNFQYYASMTSRVIRVNTAGPTQSDVATLPWTRIPRPIYPLDEPATWRG
jgi:microcystin degradation protein MlrC